MTDSIPITSILVENRQRIDHANTDGLKESLRQFGTIQPIIVEQMEHPDPRGFSYRLVAGGRRLLSLRELGFDTLFHGSTYNRDRPGFVYGKELTPDELHELELEENIRRKAMTWQEETLAIANLHRLKTIRLGEAGKKWGQRATGELLNVSVAKVNYCLAIAEGLRSSPTHPFWKMDKPVDALNWMDTVKINKANAELARRQAEMSKEFFEGEGNLTTTELQEIVESGGSVLLVNLPDAKAQAQERYLSNPHNDPAKFEEYYAERQSLPSRPPIILTPRLYLGDCLTFMVERTGCFDHIITDPPYAIDMDMLDQENQGMANIDSVREEHQVEENKEFLRKLFKAAYASLKDSGFFCLWADYSMWDYLQVCAFTSGFKYQRWPVVWIKTHTVKNSAAQYNFSKTTEIAMICRKGNATLAQTAPLGHIIAPHDEFKEIMDHPFVKPFAAWEHLVEAVSIQGQTILDPCAGQGSGPISFLRCNRNYMACEKVPEHYNKLMEHLKGYYRGLDQGATFV